MRRQPETAGRTRPAHLWPARWAFPGWGVVGALAALAAPNELGAFRWKDCLRQPATWYAGSEAQQVVENVLLYQRATGGWPKNVDLAHLSEAERRQAAAQRDARDDSTIDNGATVRELEFLARVHQAAPQARLRNAFLAGLDFLLKAQYANGGWPQFPYRSGYHQHITFNDDAMVNVLNLLRRVSRGDEPFGFVEAETRERARHAVEQGISCILACQVRVDGRLTAWCAQHDRVTLKPAPARSYELASLSGAESVGIVRFLMGIERPSPAVTAAVEAAVAWFERSRITGFKLVKRIEPSLPKGYDLVVEEAAAAPPLWARFYEVDTNRPFFCGRDGIKRYRLADIEHERRVGYAWYVTAPSALLAGDYPAWQRRPR